MWQDDFLVQLNKFKSAQKSSSFVICNQPRVAITLKGTLFAA